MLSSPFWKSPGALFGNLDFHLPCQALCLIWLKISKSCKYVIISTLQNEAALHLNKLESLSILSKVLLQIHICFFNF